MQMNDKRRKISRAASWLWLFLCMVVLIYLSLCTNGIRTIYIGKMFGIFGTFAVLVLALIGAFSGEIACLGITPENGGKKQVFCLIRIFLAGLILQFLYAGYGIYSGRGSMLTDSMVTAGIFCFTVRWYFVSVRKFHCVSDEGVLN